MPFLLALHIPGNETSRRLGFAKPARCYDRAEMLWVRNFETAGKRGESPEESLSKRRRV